MRHFLLSLLIIICCSCQTFAQESVINEVESVVKKMNHALANQQLDDLLACYSNKMNWENSFGWTIRDKRILTNYFRDWLFLKYPKLGSDRLSLELQVEIINTKTAWVDVLQKIHSEDLSNVARAYRQSHLLVKENGNWLITKTRLWLPTPNENPPLDYLSSPSFFK